MPDLDSVSSAAEAGDVHVAQDDTPAPGAVQGGASETMADAVRAAVADEPRKDAPSEDPKPAEAPKEGAEAAEGTAAEKDAEEDQEDEPDAPVGGAAEGQAEAKPKRVSFKKFERVSRELEELKPQAEEARKIRDYLATTGLSHEDAAEGMQFAAMVKAARAGRLDPKQALQALEGVRNGLLQLAGEVLPADLQTKVEQGYVDKDTARQLAQARVQADLLRTQSAEASRAAEAARETSRHASAASAINAWAERKRASDPDFARKEQFLVAEGFRMSHELGPAQTPEEAVRRAEEAHKTISQRLGEALPRPKASPRLPNGQASSPIPSRAQPNNMREAIDAAIAAVA